MSFNATQDPQSGSFRGCDNIAAFYHEQDVPYRKSVGLLGGKSYTWYPTERGQPFQVRCVCNVSSLGYGVVNVESTLASQRTNQRWFRGSPDVDQTTGEVEAQGPFGIKDHRFRLPHHDKGE